MGAFVDGAVVATVPATSANLGPGFDALGLALDYRDRLSASVMPEGLQIEVTGSGADAVPRDESHLVVRTMRRTFEVLGVEQPGLHLSCQNVIPHARGMGSSSAAIVAGVWLARALVVDGAERLDDQAAFALTADIEGHPDNVAPACFGGFTISGHDDTPAGPAWYTVEAPVDSRISTVVFIPPTPVSTEVARGLLPAQVPHAEAAANSGRAALLVAALAGRPDQLLRGTRDYLHQSYRRPAFSESLAFVEALRAEGTAAIISGAGPTVLAFSAPGSVDAEALMSRCPQGWQSLALPVSEDGVRIETC